ncbi:hypothetical protein [Nocardia sp. NPDC005978]|uniref:hypothetical protein n=1 Tax=unclassified Nocardia TaxID=2637762 RepID=UPI0033AB907F
MDSNALSLQNIVNGIEANNEQLRAMERALKSCFDGNAAREGWDPKINALLAKVNDYSLELGKLRAVLQSKLGGGGDVYNTDKAQGAKFLAVGI